MGAPPDGPAGRPRCIRRWRPLLALYAVAMGFALVYSAEHYVFDILLGWLITAAVTAGFRWWDARRRAREKNPEAGTDTLKEPLPARS